MYIETHTRISQQVFVYFVPGGWARAQNLFFLLYVSYFTVGFKSGGTPTRAHTHRKCVCVCLPPFFFMFSCVAQSFTKLKEENVFFSFSSLSFFFFLWYVNLSLTFTSWTNWNSRQGGMFYGVGWHRADTRIFYVIHIEGWDQRQSTKRCR